jgi:hypothetical protein
MTRVGNELATVGSASPANPRCTYAPGRSRTCDRDARAFLYMAGTAPKAAFHGFGPAPKPPNRTRKRPQLSNELAVVQVPFNYWRV